MVYTKKEVPINKAGNDVIHIAAFGDLHVGDVQFNRKKFIRWREECLQLHNVWFIGMGDQIEAINTRDKRFTLSHIDIAYRNDPHIEDLIGLQKRDIVNLLGPIKHRLWGLGRGNHEMKLVKRDNNDAHHDICEALGCEDLGYSFLMYVGLRYKSYVRHSFKIYGHHGWGGGSRTLGGDMSKVGSKIAEYHANVYMFGHSHQPWTHPKPQLTVDKNGNVKVENKLAVNTGTFKRTLSDGPIPSYAEEHGYSPQYLGGRIIKVSCPNFLSISSARVKRAAGTPETELAKLASLKFKAID